MTLILINVIQVMILTTFNALRKAGDTVVNLITRKVLYNILEAFHEYFLHKDCVLRLFSVSRSILGIPTYRKPSTSSGRGAA